MDSILTAILAMAQAPANGAPRTPMSPSSSSSSVAVTQPVQARCDHHDTRLSVSCGVRVDKLQLAANGAVRVTATSRSSPPTVPSVIRSGVPERSPPPRSDDLPGAITPSSLQKSESVTSTSHEDLFDRVVVCVPAPNALSIGGLEDILPPEHVRILQGVRYDRRVATACFFRPDPDFLRRMAVAFKGGAVELSLDDDDDDDDDDGNKDDDIEDCGGSGGGTGGTGGTGNGRSAGEFLSWQNAKRDGGEDGDKEGNTTCDAREVVAVVAHGLAGAGREAMPAMCSSTLHKALGRRLGLSAAEVCELQVGEKTIDWTVAQMVRPMEAIVNDPPGVANDDPPWRILAEDRYSHSYCGNDGEDGEGGKDGKRGECSERREAGGAEEEDPREELLPRIVVAGDFMTQSSFLGCVASAESAARAIAGPGLADGDAGPYQCKPGNAGKTGKPGKTRRAGKAGKPLFWHERWRERFISTRSNT